MANSTSVIYLVNSVLGASEMCWYDKIDQSLAGQIPDRTWKIPGKPGFDIIWEGQPVTGQPNAPFVFTTHINADAASQPAGTVVGTGDFGPVFAPPTPGLPTDGPVSYELWTVYRDNGRVLYSDASLGNRISIYVCTPVCDVLVSTLMGFH